MSDHPKTHTLQNKANHQKHAKKTAPNNNYPTTNTHTTKNKTPIFCGPMELPRPEACRWAAIFPSSSWSIVLVDSTCMPFLFVCLFIVLFCCCRFLLFDFWLFVFVNPDRAGCHFSTPPPPVDRRTRGWWICPPKEDQQYTRRLIPKGQVLGVQWRSLPQARLNPVVDFQKTTVGFI